MRQVAHIALFLLQCKLPALAFEQQLANAVNLSVDGVRFMLAFFAACLCGAVLRVLPGFKGALRLCAHAHRTLDIGSVHCVPALCPTRQPVGLQRGGASQHGRASCCAPTSLAPVCCTAC